MYLLLGGHGAQQVLTSVASISSVRKRAEQLSEREVNTYWDREQSLALLGFAVLQQSEICHSECNEELRLDITGVGFNLLLIRKPVKSTTEEG